MRAEIAHRIRDVLDSMQDQIVDLQEQRDAISQAWRAMDLDALVELRAITPRERDEAVAEAERSNPHMPRHPRPRGPRGGTSEPQSILVPADVYTPAQAKRWVKHHGFKVSGFEPASERTSRDGRGIYHRFRQFDPDRRHSYRTIPLGDSGIMAVIEVPKRAPRR
jgi:hypothetical protein